MAQTVKQFLDQSYRLISASSPTVPLHGDDLQMGITIINQLLNFYAATGLMLTIAKTESCPIILNQQEVIIGPSTFVPTPDIAVGRLANIDSAWIVLNNLSYPLIQKSRDEFLASFRYQPLSGLPRFVFTFPDTEVVRLRLYPAPSQTYQFFIRGKFQLENVTSTDSLDALPAYYNRFFLLSVARDMAIFKGRSDAWTPMLEERYKEAKDIMEAASEVNLTIVGDSESLLNGAYRVAAGV